MCEQMTDVKQLLDSLVDFTAEAGLDKMREIFGPAHALHLWDRFCEYEFDVVRWYSRLDTPARQAFAQAIEGQVADRRVWFVEPVCRECGGQLSAADVEAGEDVCPECAPAVMVEGVLSCEIAVLS